MKNIDKALFILVLFIVIFIVTNYIYGFSNCMTNSYKERFVISINKLRDKKNSKTETNEKNHKDLIEVTKKLNTNIVSKCIYPKDGDFVALKPYKKINNTYKIDESKHLDLSEAIKNTEFYIKYITDYNSAKKSMPIINCSNAKYPFYLLISKDNKFTIYNYKNTLILVDLLNINNLDSIEFINVEYGAYIPPPKPTTQNNLDNSRQVELILTTGGEEATPVVFNIDSKAYEKLKDVSIAQHTLSEMVPQLPITNNCVG
jgi:hypothetical protein